MSSVLVNAIRHGFYLDSVALMRMSARLAALEGVEEAVLMIGTPSNLQLMRDAAVLDAAGVQAGANDLVIAVRASHASAAENCLAQARLLIDGGMKTLSAGRARPRTLGGALDELPEANLALISTPGEFAAREARRALERGLNVMIFSDNVPLAEEKALKDEALRRGLIVMGPDCGTAYIDGVPLAFANAISAGRIGVIAASGTGLQEFSVLVTRLGAGIRHGIGVGGRDLSDDIGAVSTLSAIDLLAADDAVSELVLISKPPGAATAARVFERLARCGKPVTACVFGLGVSAVPPGIRFVSTLKQAAESAAGARFPPPAREIPALAGELAAALAPSRRLLRGLYCGGTLCTEAQGVLADAGVAVESNAAVPASGTGSATGGIVIEGYVSDLGADEYTLGRPHPMIEPAVREPLLAQALADPTLAVVLLDVVLGYGAHPDPAAGVARLVAGAGRDRPAVVAAICGTDADPQGHAAQAKALRDAGVIVMPCNADAAALAACVIVERRSAPRGR